jgi:hypothetical protein
MRRTEAREKDKWLQRKDGEVRKGEARQCRNFGVRDSRESNDEDMRGRRNGTIVISSIPRSDVTSLYVRSKGALKTNIYAGKHEEIASKRRKAR